MPSFRDRIPALGGGGLPALVMLLGAMPVQAEVRVVVIPTGLVSHPDAKVCLQASVEGAAGGVIWTSDLALPVPGMPGTFLMPHTDSGTMVTVRATSVQDGHAYAEATIVVLPATKDSKGTGALIDAYQPSGPWSNALPFLDVESSGPGKNVRFGPPGAVVFSDSKAVHYPVLAHQAVGYGLKAELMLDSKAASAQAALLSCTLDQEVLRTDVSGRSVVPGFQLWGQPSSCFLETLTPAPGKPGHWLSRGGILDIRVRGAVPLAGNAVTEPDHKDGRGLSARFQAPCGMVTVHSGDAWQAVVVDSGSHTLRRVLPDGTVSTLCGAPGVGGHRDGSAGQALFRTPTFIAGTPHRIIHDELDPPFFVADTGNHVIRKVDKNGLVTTFAGTPERPGSGNSANPLEAQFRAPRGLALDAASNLYVADSGNHVIRKIAADGTVSTLTGQAGQPGTEDGGPETARFTNLKGLVWGGACLYVTDGHAVRRIELEDGRVTTLVGQVDKPGFLPTWDTEEGPRPCLNDPWGLTYRHWLQVADTGNGAVREVFERKDGTLLRTLAGGPGAASTRWGLLTDQAPWPWDNRYAALAAPKGLSWCPGLEGGDLLVTLDRCLGNLSLVGDLCSGGRILRHEALAHLHPAPGKNLRLNLADLGIARLTKEGRVPCTWTVELIDPRGSVVVARTLGTLSSNPHEPSWCSIRIPPKHEGPVRARLTCVWQDGFTTADELELEVAEPQPQLHAPRIK